MTEQRGPRKPRQQKNGQGSGHRRGQGQGGGRGRQQGGRPNGNRQQGGRTQERERLDAPRKVALEVLADVRKNDAYANLVLPKLLRARKISGRDAAFATEITYGTLRAQGVLDQILARASTRPLSDIEPEILDVLRLGAYQLLKTRVGAHAAVDTSVIAVQAASKPGAKGFVNAILRKVSQQDFEHWVMELVPNPAADPLGYLATKYAHPKWIVEAFAQSLGANASELEAALAGAEERPIVHLVARPGEISAEELALITGGEEGPYSPYAVRLDGGDPGSLDPVRDGLAAVQDEGSQLIARAVTQAPVSGEDHGRWLDLCAGPGGKATFMGAIAAIDGAKVDAVEVAAHRAELISKTVRDLPVSVHIADGRNPGLEGGYDRILVDAPCSGLGALRRRPEARWRKQPTDIPELVTLQKELLASAAKLVRPGGIVVYSTCSPLLRETRSIVADAVKNHGFVELDAQALVAPMTDVGPGPSVQMWPHRHGTDAMFFAILQRPESDTNDK